MNYRPNWLEEQLTASRTEIDKWPQWKKDAIILKASNDKPEIENKMKVLIAGSRSILDYNLFYNALSSILTVKGNTVEYITKNYIKEIVSGCAIGVDTLAIRFALEHNIYCKKFPANWRPNGVFNPRAGFERNQKMIDYLDSKTDVVILIWTGSSNGTADTKERAIKKGLKVYEGIIN